VEIPGPGELPVEIPGPGELPVEIPGPGEDDPGLAQEGP
jgi:hypothetical protein